tara:strand:- start:158 stop:559 length:402 start_codon:yes stop_codon:yes gene_type:complete
MEYPKLETIPFETIKKVVKNCETIKKKERRNSSGEVCVHYFSKIPNNKEGLGFIKSIRKFVNKKRYKVRVLGRGSRKLHGNAYSIPLKYSETFSVYIDHKIMDRNNPSFLARKNWKIRSLVSELNNAINHGDN